MAEFAWLERLENVTRVAQGILSKKGEMVKFISSTLWLMGTNQGGICLISFS
jgi:hypothetical protein